MEPVKFFYSALLSVLISCSGFIPKPTPLLVGDLINLNNEVQALYLACLEEGVYKKTKEGCQSDLLDTKIKKTRDVAKDFISADIKQPHGYDIYLQTTLIYFRMGLKAEEDYSEAEKIARQFFEVQKASSGRALNTARFYWAATSAEHAAWQINFKPELLTEQRKQVLLLCGEEATVAFENTDDIFIKGRLVHYIQVIILITSLP